MEGEATDRASGVRPEREAVKVELMQAQDGEKWRRGRVNGIQTYWTDVQLIMQSRGESCDGGEVIPRVIELYVMQMRNLANILLNVIVQLHIVAQQEV